MCAGEAVGDTGPTYRWETGDTGCDIDDDCDGYAPMDGDCDETNPDINPAAPEVCDGIDNNCDGRIDEDATVTGYADLDEDGFGDP